MVKLASYLLDLTTTLIAWPGLLVHVDKFWRMLALSSSSRHAGRTLQVGVV